MCLHMTIPWKCVFEGKYWMAMECEWWKFMVFSFKQFYKIYLCMNCFYFEVSWKYWAIGSVNCERWRWGGRLRRKEQISLNFLRGEEKVPGGKGKWKRDWEWGGELGEWRGFGWVLRRFLQFWQEFATFFIVSHI